MGQLLSNPVRKLSENPIQHNQKYNQPQSTVTTTEYKKNLDQRYNVSMLSRAEKKLNEKNLLQRIARGGNVRNVVFHFGVFATKRAA